MRYLVIGIAAILAACWSMPAGADESTDVLGVEALSPSTVARVNGEAILLEDLEQQLELLHGAVETQRRSEFAVEKLVTKLVNDVLIAQEARVLEFDADLAIRHQVDGYRDEQLVKMLLRREVDEVSVPTDEAVRAEFERQYRRATFRVLTAYEREGATSLLEELQGGADIEALATERSVDPYRMRGGLVVDLARVDVQREVADVVFALDPGQTAGPVRTDLGWSIVHVESFAAADEERFENVRKTIASLLRLETARARRDEIAAQAAERHKVARQSEIIESVVPLRMPDARLIPQASDPEAVAVRIGEFAVITAGEYADALLLRWTGMRNEDAARAAAPIVLEQLIRERLLLAESRRRKFDEDPELVRRLRLYETSLIVPRYLQQVVAGNVKVTREELQAHYDANRESFRRPPRVRVSQLTVATQEEADRIASQVRAGADIAWLAREQSKDRFGPTGGDRGWLNPTPGGDELNQQLLAAEVGAVIGPYGALDSWIVLKVTAREEQGVYPFDEISGNVREAVFAERFIAELEAFMEKLRSRAEIEINHDAVADLTVMGALDEQSSGGGSGGRAH